MEILFVFRHGFKEFYDHRKCDRSGYDIRDGLGYLNSGESKDSVHDTEDGNENESASDHGQEGSTAILSNALEEHVSIEGKWPEKADAETIAETADQAGVCKGKAGRTGSKEYKGSGCKISQFCYQGCQENAGDSQQDCFASGNNRYLCTDSDYDHDSHIVLWGDVLRWYEYHTGRKLYECSGGD